MKIKFAIIAAIFLKFPAFASIVINGIDNEEILSIIKNQIISNKDQSTAQNSVSNNFKIENDQKIIKTILASFGYFDAETETKAEKNKIVFNIKLNTRYKLNEVLLQYQDFKNFRSGVTVIQVFDLVNMKFDSHTTTKQISSASLKITDFLKKYGFAFVEIDRPSIEIDRKFKKIKAIYNIRLNKKIIIDRTLVNIKCKKDPKLLETFVRNRIEWKNGSIWDISKINNTTDNLTSSKIFSEINIKLSQPVPDQNHKHIAHCDAIVDVSEDLLRNTECGIRYSTTEKLATSFVWSHNNIDGKGSILSTKFDIANFFEKEKRRFSAKAEYSLYDTFASKQEIQNQVIYLNLKTTPYDLSRVGAKCIFWQQISKSLKIGFGPLSENSKTKDHIDESTTKFVAFGIPLEMSIDTTDSFLNPQKGFRWTNAITQYFANKNCLSIITEKASIYIPIKKQHFKNATVIAFYASSGAIIHSQKGKKIPRDKLFFSGGTNSIRGYGDQKLGPINNDKIPLGGKYMLEFGLEPRIKIGENLELAIFVEAGNVYSSKLQSLLVGYGIGFRYNTILGPIRFDIGFPAKIRRTKNNKKIDSMFNIYISIGQAF